MILFAVEANGPATNDEWSIVTIWKDEDKANSAMRQYEDNCEKNNVDYEYRIKRINTDNECVYDFEQE